MPTALRAVATGDLRRWPDMNDGPHLFPSDLLRYFVTLADGKPDVDEWTAGVALTRRWIALMESHGATQAQVTSLLDDIASRQDPGSGWLDLWLRARYWAMKEGFEIAYPGNPWAR